MEEKSLPLVNNFSVKIDIVVPSYIKDFDCILGCIKNLSEQTIKPNNIIICVSEITNEQFIFLENEVNSMNMNVNVIINYTSNKQCAAENRNRGIQYCLDYTHPDYIMFCDCDDVVHTKKLEIFFKCVKYNKNINLLTHNYTLSQVDFDIYSDVNNDKSLLLLCYNHPHCSNLYTIPETHIHHGHIIVKSELCKEIKYDATIFPGEDGNFCQKINTKFGNVYSYNEKLVNYLPY
jgi:glycosyltransferase involved in cell wall biosynthesis